MAEPEREQAGLDWPDQVPPVLWPVPVSETPALLGEDFTLVGKRVVIGTGPAGQWVYEQRASTPIHERDGQSVIGVLSEAEWYRQQREPTYPVVPHPVPVELAYYEALVPMHDATPITPDQSDLFPASRSASLVTDPTEPPVRWPRRATSERFLTGARCWFLWRDGPIRAYRAVGEPRREEVGTVNLSRGLEGLDKPVVSTVVPLFHEADWYRWLDTGDSPDSGLVRAETNLVFLE